MPNRCGTGCQEKKKKGQPNRLPREEEKQMWLDVIPVRRNFSIDPRKYFICERHWPSKYPEVTYPVDPLAHLFHPVSSMYLPHVYQLQRYLLGREKTKTDF